MRRFTLHALLFTLFATALPAQSIPTSEYATRRDSLAARIDSGVVVAFGGRTPVGPERFAQLPAFRYLTGFLEPDAALVMVVRPGSTRATLFTSERDPRRALYDGFPPDSAEVARRTGIEARSIGALPGQLDSLANSALPFYTLHDFATADAAETDSLTRGRHFMQLFADGHPKLVVRDAHPILDSLRTRKSPAEVAMLRRAIDLTGGGLREVMRALKPGMMEYEVEAMFQSAFRRGGGDGDAFVAIVGSGPNSTQYHYNANDRRIGKGEVIVMDVGAAFGGYTADVTRTLPANGRFSPEQRAVYQIVRDAQEAAAKVAKPGAHVRRLARRRARGHRPRRGEARPHRRRGCDVRPAVGQPVRDRPGRLHPGLPLYGPWARPRHWPGSARSSASLVWGRHLSAGGRVHHRARDLREPQAAGDPPGHAEEPRDDRQGPFHGRAVRQHRHPDRGRLPHHRSRRRVALARAPRARRGRGRDGALTGLLVLFVTAFVDMVGLAMIVPLLPYYATDFGAGAATVGLLISAFSVAQLAVAPLWGKLSDRYGRRPAILAGLLITAAAYILFAFASSVPALLLTRVVQGIGGGTIGVVQAYVAEWLATRSADQESRLALRDHQSGRGGRPGVRLADGIPRRSAVCRGSERRGSRRWSRYSPGDSSASLGGCRRRAGQSAQVGTGRAAIVRVLSRWHEPAPRLIWIYTVGIGAFYGTIQIVPLLLADRLGVTERTVGYFVMYLGGMGVVVRALVLGRAVDQLGEARLARLGIVILAVGLIATGLGQGASRSPRDSRSCPWARRSSFPASPGFSPPPCRPGSAVCTWAFSTPSAGSPVLPSPSPPDWLMDRFGLGVPFWLAGLLVLVTLPLTRSIGHAGSGAPRGGRRPPDRRRGHHRRDCRSRRRNLLAADPVRRSEPRHRQRPCATSRLSGVHPAMTLTLVIAEDEGSGPREAPRPRGGASGYPRRG